MKHKKTAAFFISFAVLFMIPVHACANSSWGWISEKRPYDVLPFIIAVTLIIETIAVNFIPKIHRPLKAFITVCAANHISFLAPYFFAYTIPSLYTFKQELEHTPFYTIGITYLFITIAIELPIVYNILKKDTENKKTLMITIIAVNILTTIICAVTERIICYGEW